MICLLLSIILQTLQIKWGIPNLCIIFLHLNFVYSNIFATSTCCHFDIVLVKQSPIPVYFCFYNYSHTAYFPLPDMIRSIMHIMWIVLQLKKLKQTISDMTWSAMSVWGPKRNFMFADITNDFKHNCTFSVMHYYWLLTLLSI